MNSKPAPWDHAANCAAVSVSYAEAMGWTREDLERATDAVYEVNKPYLDDLAGTHEWLGNEQLQRAWARTQARAALRAVNGDMNTTR